MNQAIFNQGELLALGNEIQQEGPAVYSWTNDNRHSECALYTKEQALCHASADASLSMNAISSPRKLVISAAFDVSHGVINMSDVLQSLKKLGACHVHYSTLTEMAQADPLGRDQWVYVPNGFAEEADIGLRLVENAQTSEGREVLGDALDALLNEGVCVEMIGQYPRYRYGAPHAAVHEDYAIGVVGEIGFAVDQQAFKSSIKDRGDDGAPDIWLRIRLPRDKASS